MTALNPLSRTLPGKIPGIRLPSKYAAQRETDIQVVRVCELFTEMLFNCHSVQVCWQLDAIKQLKSYLNKSLYYHSYFVGTHRRGKTNEWPSDLFREVKFLRLDWRNIIFDKKLRENGYEIRQETRLKRVYWQKLAKYIRKYITIAGLCTKNKRTRW